MKKIFIYAPLLFSLHISHIVCVLTDEQKKHSMEEHRNHALHEAVRLGSGDFVQRLLDMGTNPNIADKYGLTPLDKAVCKGNNGIVQKLLDAGASPNTSDVWGCCKPLHFAVKRGDLKNVQALLVAGANPDDIDIHGDTALHEAVRFVKHEIVQALVDAGADIHIKNKLGCTPFSIATTWKWDNTAKALCAPPAKERGAVTTGDNTTLLNAILSVAKNNTTTSAPKTVEKDVVKNTNVPLTLTQVQESIDAKVPSLQPIGMAVLFNAVLSEALAETTVHEAISYNDDDTTFEVSQPYNDPKELSATMMGYSDVVVIRNNDGCLPATVERQDSKDDSTLCAASLSHVPARGLILHEAIEKGSAQEVKILIAGYPAELNSIDVYGNTPLQKAICAGGVDIVEELLIAGADLNIVNKDGMTPLHLAIMKNNIDIVRTLLAFKADPKILFRNATALDMAKYYSYFEIVKLLEDTCAHRKDDVHQDVYQVVLENVNAQEVKKLLDDRGDLNVEGENGLTPLGNAINEGNIEAVQEFLLAGANPNATDRWNVHTPLHLAVMYKQVETIKALLAFNADTCIATQNGTALDLAKKHYPDPEIMKLLEDACIRSKIDLHEAIKKENVKEVEELLVNGADPNTIDQYNYFTPLHLAVKTKNIEIIRLLHRFNANSKIITQVGTALDMAKKSKNAEIIKLFADSPNNCRYCGVQ
ncbi:MAG TPA: ankyrin repeat domain-containing protein [Candidatus Saccharimonadales bacterium]|nr:ankyrin repeat domain-containing protein [Candidatus Saccharimonadales bacterium]